MYGDAAVSPDMKAGGAMAIRLNGIGPQGRLRQVGNGGSGNGKIGGGGIDNADGANGGGIYPH